MNSHTPSTPPPVNRQNHLDALRAARTTFDAAEDAHAHAREALATARAAYVALLASVPPQALSLPVTATKH